MTSSLHVYWPAGFDSHRFEPVAGNVVEFFILRSEMETNAQQEAARVPLAVRNHRLDKS
jgi:hypothetical protein